MSNHTFPYVADAEDRIRYSLGHIFTAIAYPDNGTTVPLDVEDMSVEFDDSRTPRIQANLTCKVPADKAVLDSLDARKTFRVQIYAGYKYNSVEEDSQLLCDLHVRSREVRRPDNRLILTCWSDEGLAMDRLKMAWDTQPPQTNLLAAVQFHVAVSSIGSPTPAVVSDYPATFGNDAVAGLTQEPGQSNWSVLYESAVRAGVSIYCEPDRTWRIAKPQALSSTTSLNFNTGGGGIIKESNSVTSRENFKNAVCIGYKWRDSGGIDRVIYGHAYIGSGPLSIYSIGYNTYYEERELPVTQTQANAAASAMLKALSRRGRSFVVESVSAYWLRPGMTVTATLPEGDQERLLVSAVRFNFPSGAMSVRLRTPEDVLISNS